MDKFSALLSRHVLGPDIFENDSGWAKSLIYHLTTIIFMASVESHLRIGSCLACVYRVMDACGKFGEHEA